MRCGERLAECEFDLFTRDIGAQAQTAGPNASNVVRAAAIFDHRQRANGETTAKISGFANARDNRALRMKLAIKPLHIAANLLSKR